ncbi:hypothetical protein CC80DRAFT_443245 [Byssothecium circinans]|uniref:Response regulatory domain-containing protein n=1 Tax=Byssothecium circinans TaxID=147558 RepID=A0A6A5U280_9PLEO|nr:hypothetical protein CC80DRAFT_443245 [Byssothecium circinans]
MTSIKARLNSARAKLLRRESATSTVTAGSAASERAPKSASTRSLRPSVSLSKLPRSNRSEEDGADTGTGTGTGRLSKSEVLASNGAGTKAETERDHQQNTTGTFDSPDSHQAGVRSACPVVTLEAPTPVHVPVQLPRIQSDDVPAIDKPSDPEPPAELPAQSTTKTTKQTPPGLIRRQSLVDPVNARAITFLDPEILSAAVASGLPTAASHLATPSNFNSSMLHRKIWVKRPHASATLVQIREDDLVDDVREMILRKYGNSLGRSFDAPDILLRIVPRDNNNTASKSQDRVLGPEEEMCRTLDAYYPGGQSVNEALVIEVPKPRTPKPSPRIPVYYAHHDDSATHQTEYFPPMPIVSSSPAGLTAVAHETRATLAHAPHSIAVLQSGQLPALPSPGNSRRPHSLRPKNARHNTASPTTLTSAPHSSTSTRMPNRPRQDSSASESKHSAATNAPIPTPPAPVEPSARQNSTPPTPRVSSPRPDKKRKKQRAVEPPSLPAGLLDGSVPPINVLIVEDNIINLRVLGAFMQRLKVRWQKAMDGREAVTKWRTGGFHLVLMDIQLPIMDGLEATREIRRLERVNSIGVFSSGSSEAPNNRLGLDSNYGKNIKEDDKLGDRSLFKSPVIIVALTASSLQSDRHEALAAGCNDFLTKPVNFVWLERKVKEWGCMQALIDFDGWRKWKDFAADSDSTSKTSKLTIPPRKVKNNIKTSQAANQANGDGSSTSNGVVTKPKEEEKKSKRRSMGIVPPPALPEEDTAPEVGTSGG